MTKRLRVREIHHTRISLIIKSCYLIVFCTDNLVRFVKFRKFKVINDTKTTTNKTNLFAIASAIPILFVVVR